MNRGLVTPQRVLVGLVLLMVVSSLLPVRHADKLAAMPRWVVEKSLAPTVQTLTWTSSQIRSGSPSVPDIAGDARFADNYDAMSVYAKALEQEIARLQQEIVDLKQIPERVRGAVTLVPARVIAGPRDRQDPVLTINRGQSHGVEPGMIVASGYNLVGLVIPPVDRAQARVRLITAPTMTMSVTILPQLAPPGEAGMPANLRLDRSGRAFVADTLKDDPVQVGDLVHLRDPTWPAEAAGYIVGRVARIIENPADTILRRLAVIEPRVDLLYLTQVHVVKKEQQ
jgi:cell shape-determining protein MreC